MKIRESHLQNGIFIYKMGISLTKQDFKLQKESFGLQTGLSVYYLPLVNSEDLTNVQNNKLLFGIRNKNIAITIFCVEFVKRRAIIYSVMI